ncbi:hypothetical protein [Actinophytocola sp.]|uniref:hypothetical protein n=1 Tax=Actinophytocola sp. TaxID=1872138 RepID=UPI002D54626A|nr:hypothetical protein [Actinophytocola sp.]HYQ64584.1 hypothetical protein [Actinophytocola sp.]
MSTAAIVVLVVVLLAVLFAAGWFLGGRARSRRLRNRFGPEYERSLESADNRRAAERELTEREKRHAQLSLKPLSVAARARYTEQWARLQERFVDDPAGTVGDASELVHAVMRDRGYPTDGFDQQAADLSVEHGSVVGNYRDAHRVHGRGDAQTEDLRNALVHYRTVFRSLVGPIETVAPVDVPAARENADHPVDQHSVDQRSVDQRSVDHNGARVQPN